MTVSGVMTLFVRVLPVTVSGVMTHSLEECACDRQWSNDTLCKSAACDCQWCNDTLFGRVSVTVSGVMNVERSWLVRLGGF